MVKFPMGESESSHDYAIQSKSESEGKPLQPLTEIMPNAQGRMQEWGVSEESVLELRDMTAAFRYDNVPDRLQEIFTRNNVFVTTDQEGTKYAVIPNYYDAGGMLEGNCQVLGFQFLKNPQVQAWVEDQNDMLKEAGKPSLELALCFGKAGEFFTAPTSDHFWVAVKQEGVRDPQEFIDIDPALQKIGTKSEDGYKHRRVFHDVDNVKMPLTEKLKVGTLSPVPDGGGFSYSAPDQIVLGVSSDRQNAYSLSFAENMTTGDLVPIVTRSDKGDQDNGFFFLEPNSGEVYEGGYKTPLTPEEDQEISQLLKACQQMKTNTDMNQFPYPIDKATLEDEGGYKIAY